MKHIPKVACGREKGSYDEFHKHNEPVLSKCEKGNIENHMRYSMR